MAQLQQGYMFDSRYRLLRKLGEGGYSEVWLVEDTSVGMELVLKIFLPSAQLDDASVDLFRKEFKLVYNLNHPNLLKYSYFDVCVEYPYLLMPYYDRGSAESMIGQCSESTAWRYLRDVASGLACLHAQHPAIIHQDIKPANVLLDHSGNFIITDFGISANMHSLFAGRGSRTVQGTRPYMPPEKFLENPQIYEENDIWSLGASLYELLTGNLPFGERGGENQLQAPALPQRPANISYDMWKVISNCLHRYPEQRPTAKELENYAEEMLNPTPYISQALSNPYTTSGNHSSGVSSSYSGQNYSNYSGQSGYSHPSNNPKPYKERNFLPWIIAAAGVIIIAVMVVLFAFLIPDKPKDSPQDLFVVEQNDTGTNQKKPVKQNPSRSAQPRVQKEVVDYTPTTSSENDYQTFKPVNELSTGSASSNLNGSVQERIVESEKYGY